MGAEAARQDVRLADGAATQAGEAQNTRQALLTISSRVGATVIRVLPTTDSDTDPQVAWLARHLTGLKVGLTLGAGGALGFAHVGVLSGLTRAGVPVDYIAGTSIGAIIAGAFAYGIEIDVLSELLAGASSQAVKLTLPRHSIFSHRGLKRMFRELIGDTAIEDLPVPLSTVAVDIAQRRKVVLQSGLLWKAALASAAIPGIYPPIWIQDHCLVDGAVLDPVPVEVTRAMGADVVLAVSLLTNSNAAPLVASATDTRAWGRTPNLVNTLQRSYDVMASEVGMRAVSNANVNIVVQSEPIGLRQFARAQRLAGIGETALARAWPDVERTLPWLRNAPSRISAEGVA